MARWRTHLIWMLAGAVLLEIPTPPPGLDRALADDYRRALVTQGFQVISLVITDRRAAGGVRRAEIAYRTRTAGTLSALKPEVVRVIAPSANPKLALDLVVVRAARRDGSVAAAITIQVAVIDRWLKAQISDDEFFGRWIVRRS
ncbi:MAG: hypothetical protein FJX73_08680 [Armatimonadetes bacterium]|nr:hypothetical protein [Armatimonadota bacterium]